VSIAHVNFMMGGAGSAGAERKIAQQADAAVRVAGDGNAIDFYVLKTSPEKSHGQVHYKRIRTWPYPLQYYQQFCGKFDTIERTVDLSGHDAVIVRYPNADRSGMRFVQRRPVIFEHHTRQVAEIRSLLRSPSDPARWLMNLLRLYLEKRYGPPLMEAAAGMVGVTREIVDGELGRLRRPVPAAVVPNGIDVASVPLTGFRRYDGEVLRMAMLASQLSPWHGLDRLMRSLHADRGALPCELHVIGDVPERVARPYRCRVVFHGVRRGAELDSLLRQMHMGVSTLGLFRKRMNEACSLKTREYTARGLPFLLGYEDPDLEQVDPARRFYLKVPNDGTLLDMVAVHRWLLDLNRRAQPQTTSEYMRGYAMAHMDLDVKMAAYVDFAKGLAASADTGGRADR